MRGFLRLVAVAVTGLAFGLSVLGLGFLPRPLVLALIALGAAAAAAYVLYARRTPTAVIDLTLSRLDASFFTGTRWEGDLTELELQWGRTIGQLPSPYTGGNPLLAPYRWNQGR